MNTFKLALVLCTLACICIGGVAQSADDNSDSTGEHQLAGQQEISAEHLLARIMADELMAQHKFGLARHTLRCAQQVLHSRRDDIPQSIFAFLDALGLGKLQTIDKQELVFLRKRLAAERARRAQAATKVPKTSETPATQSLPRAPSTATTPARPARAAQLSPPAPRSVRQGLKRRISIVQYRQASFADVLDELRSKSGTNIVTNWQSLANLGIYKTTLVSLELRNVSAGLVLKLMLRNLSSSYGRVSYIIQDNVVFIAASQELDMIFELGVYEIADLLMETKDKRGGPEFSPGGSNRDRSDRQPPNNSRRPR